MIRDATLNDVSHLLGLSARMHAESRYAKFSLSLEKLSRLYTALINSPWGIVLLSEHGCIIGAVDEYWFGYDLYAYEYVLYVDPEHRGKSEAQALIKAYQTRSAQLGVKDIHIENTTGVEVDRTERLFALMGFERVGGNFIQSLDASGPERRH